MQWWKRLQHKNEYLLLTELEVCNVSYGPNFFHSDLWPKRGPKIMMLIYFFRLDLWPKRGPKIRAEKTRIRNLHYGPRKQG